MNDLERLYRQLVATMNANGARWQDPVRLADLMNVLPYRSARRVLSIDSSEEFELLVLRLAGGEGGYMSTEPEAVGQRFAMEAVSTNPELAVLREFKDACLMFVPGPLMKVLSGASADEEWAPPGTRTPVPAPPPPSAPVPESRAPQPAPLRAPEPRTNAPAASARPAAPRTTAPAPSPPPSPTSPTSPRCPSCSRGLPAGRRVSFCPHCGQGQAVGHCARCGADADLAWQFCADCGVGLPWGTYR